MLRLVTLPANGLSNSMESLLRTPASVFAALLAFVVLVLVTPTVRVRRRTGVLPLAFRRESSTTQKAVGLAFLVSLLGVLVLAAIPMFSASQSGSSSLGWTITGWILMLIGFLTAFVGQRTMGDSWRIGIANGASDLVTTGIFAWIRNPVFVGILVAVGGFVVLVPTRLGILLWLLLLTTIHLQVRNEERHLADWLGEPYVRYASNVGRFIPYVGRLKP